MTNPTPLSERLPEYLFTSVHEAMGAASMAWIPIPSTEVFDSTRAAEIALELCRDIADWHEKETSRLRADLTAAQEAREEAVHSIMYIRCIDHRNVPQYNRIEDTGAECPACEVEGLAERLEKAEVALQQQGRCPICGFPAALVSKEVGR